MKNTLLNRLFVKNQLLKYCAIVKIVPPVDLVFEMYHTSNVIEKSKHFHAHYWQPLEGTKQGLLFVNLSTRKTKQEIDYDIAHEVIHMKYPELRHGPAFEKKVKQLMTNRYR